MGLQWSKKVISCTARTQLPSNLFAQGLFQRLEIDLLPAMPVQPHGDEVNFTSLLKRHGALGR